MGQLYFVRHGQTAWNAENKICGVTDIPLTPLGQEQADETGKEFLRRGIRADLILHSPLSRAAETAARISAHTGTPMQPEQRLTEQCFGRFEATARDGAEFQAAKRQFLTRFDGGESMLRLAQRIYNLLDELTGDGRTFILVAHNGIARMVHSYFYELSNEDFAAFGIKNCQIMRYDF